MKSAPTLLAVHSTVTEVDQVTAQDGISLAFLSRCDRLIVLDDVRVGRDLDIHGERTFDLVAPTMNETRV